MGSRIMNKGNLIITAVGTASLILLLLFFFNSVPEHPISGIVENITGIPMMYDNSSQEYKEIITPYHTNATMMK